MKVFRSELQVGLKKKLFEIPSKSMDLDSIRFYENSIKCTISSEKSPHGYYLRGELNIPFLEQCDRCLADFKTEHDVDFSILFTDNKELVTDEEFDVVYFTEQQDNIDIAPVLMEYMILDRSLKKLCSQDCKGMCSLCGCNLNEANCNCMNDKTDPRWNSLNKLN